MIRSLIIGIGFSLGIAFPDSTDPQMIQPPLIRPFGVEACVVELFQNVECSSWNQVTNAPLKIPDACADKEWSKVIL